MSSYRGGRGRRGGRRGQRFSAQLLALAVLAVSGSLVVIACSSDENTGTADSGTANAGNAGQTCFPNGGCNAGLSCLGGVCTVNGISSGTPSSSGTSGSSGSSSGNDGGGDSGDDSSSGNVGDATLDAPKDAPTDTKPPSLGTVWLKGTLTAAGVSSSSGTAAANQSLVVHFTYYQTGNKLCGQGTFTGGLTSNKDLNVYEGNFADFHFLPKGDSTGYVFTTTPVNADVVTALKMVPSGVNYADVDNASGGTLLGGALVADTAKVDDPCP